MSSLLKLLPLILYTASLITSLPIISKPLENNPDHLVWEALLTIDTRNIDPDKTRKVPKSIFITPNLNESKITCPTGHKLGPDGKCYKTLNIDPLDILKTQIASLFNRNRTTIEYDEYDYSDYSESTESMNGDAAGTIAQYDVPINLRFPDEQRPSSSRFPTRVIKDESKIMLNYDEQPFRVSTVDVASSGTLKSYSVYTERSTIAESSTADTISTTPRSIPTASLGNADASTKREETTTDASSATTDATTSSTATSSLETTEYARPTINVFHETTTESVSVNITADAISTTTTSTPATTMPTTTPTTTTTIKTTTTMTNYSSTSPTSSSTVERENVTPTIEIKTEIVPNLLILNKIILNETSYVKTGIEPELVANDSEEIAKSSTKVERLPLHSTEETVTVHSSSTHPPELLVVTEVGETTSAKSIDEDIATSSPSSTSSPHSASSVHRFSISTTATSNLAVEDRSADRKSSTVPSPTSTDSNRKIEALSASQIQFDRSDAISTSSTASSNEKPLALSINRPFDADAGYDIENASVINGSSIDDVHEIEIVQKDENSSLVDDIDYVGIDDDIGSKSDIIEVQNLTARLAEESLFQGSSQASNTKYDTFNTTDGIFNITKNDSNNDSIKTDSFANSDIATQLDALDDVTATTEQPFYIDTKGDEHQTNASIDEIAVATPIVDVHINSDGDEASTLIEVTTATNHESPSMYTTLINSLQPNLRTINTNEDNDGAIIVQTGNSNVDMYRIAATTDTDNDNENENGSAVTLGPSNAEHNETNADAASQSEIDQTIRLGKNCYLKNYLEHYYIMCT